MVWTPISLAGAPQDDALAATQVTVRELLKLDSDMALRRLRESNRPGALMTNQSTLQAEEGRPTLVAIYGVGPRLLAQIHINGERYVYMRGQPFAIGRHLDQSPYMLKHLSGSCVQLERSGEEHTLCLQPAMATLP